MNMKPVLFIAAGGLFGIWLYMQYNKKKKAQTEQKPGAAIVDVVETTTKPDAIMPSTMVEKFDATDNATVSPASVTIEGAGTLDDMDCQTAYSIR